MTMQDPISDMLTRIRNAGAVGKKSVSMPDSNKKRSILEILKQEGFINGYDVETTGAHPELVVQLKYHDGKQVIDRIDRASRPSLRVYKGKDDLPKVLGGFGVAIISTSKGVMTDREARAQGVGGEIMCYVA